MNAKIMKELIKDLRVFDHYPESSSCFFCGTKEDSPCVLIEVDGTGDGRICEAEPVHLKCIMDARKWRMNRDMGVIYGWRK